MPAPYARKPRLRTALVYLRTALVHPCDVPTSMSRVRTPSSTRRARAPHPHASTRRAHTPHPRTSTRHAHAASPCTSTHRVHAPCPMSMHHHMPRAHTTSTRRAHTPPPHIVRTHHLNASCARTASTRRAHAPPPCVVRTHHLPHMRTTSTRALHPHAHYIHTRTTSTRALHPHAHYIHTRTTSTRALHPHAHYIHTHTTSTRTHLHSSRARTFTCRACALSRVARVHLHASRVRAHSRVTQRTGVFKLCPRATPAHPRNCAFKPRPRTGPAHTRVFKPYPRATLAHSRSMLAHCIQLLTISLARLVTQLFACCHTCIHAPHPYACTHTPAAIRQHPHSRTVAPMHSCTAPSSRLFHWRDW
ncbi:hypothetical protein BU17DRAFT_95145 [Hysterangium stoloniferum]|nr:hypothetical protein BU17DRAFT_95145 [Hysterangium stoloniferum]